MAKFSKSNAPPKGMPTGGSKKLDRGATAKAPGKSLAERPPKLSRGVSNDFFADTARSAVMPPPGKDTQEPRMSHRQAPKTPPAMIRGSGKGISKGRR